MELKDSAKTGPPRRGFREAWSLLRRNPAFARLYAATLISFAGDWFLQVALYGLVLELTGSPLLTSLVLVAQLLPFTLLSPLGGVLADRLDRRKLMIVSDTVRAAVVCLGFLCGGRPRGRVADLRARRQPSPRWGRCSSRPRRPRCRTSSTRRTSPPRTS